MLGRYPAAIEIASAQTTGARSRARYGRATRNSARASRNHRVHDGWAGSRFVRPVTANCTIVQRVSKITYGAMRSVNTRAMRHRVGSAADEK